MPSRLPHKLALILAALAIALPSEALAQRHGGKSHGGGWQGGGGRGHHPGYGGRHAGRDGYGRNSGYYGYRGYDGYRRYSGYRGYGGYSGYYGYGGYYHRNRHDNDAWIAIGAGLLGVVLGSVIGQRRAERYDYPSEAPPQTAPAMQQCPDGSTIPVGSYCQAPPPAATSRSMDERG